ncbi:MAG: pyruvate ferredoxin oxidoreductase subunit gamma [Candidatus Diapherotrites archaeon]|nr:pyruvate ferredoxin oxidoreductase subunit gamma [Candidatus Diapherotrites archaeon]
MPLKEVRIHGRGGQGAVTASEVLAVAAFYDGKYCQAFPSFGVERRGAPVEAFTRIADEPINIREHVYEPDYVILLDPTLLFSVDVARGVKDSGIIIINSNRPASEFGLNTKAKVETIDMTAAAMEIIGKPFVNIASLGAFAAITNEVTLESVFKAIDQEFAHKKAIGELNKKAAEKLYKMFKGE